jgi:ADP-heptose:LPS heptosyltransferase
MASLIYHAGALGDFITTLPAMSAWRRLHPRQRIVLLGRPAYAALADPTTLFDETWDAASGMFAPLFSPDPDPSPLLAERFSLFTSALLFAFDSSPLEKNLTKNGVREITRQDPFPSARVPIVDYHLALFPRLPFNDRERIPRVLTTGPGLPTTPETVLLHPGSGSQKKNWPLTRFVELARRCAADGESVAWIMGPAEEGIILPPGAQVWRGVSLSALASAMGRSRLYVGNDSGITHLSAASGCPTVALFGASDPAVWAPRGRAVKIASATSTGRYDISVEDVYAECEKLSRMQTRGR